MAPAKLSERAIAGPLLRVQPDRRLVALAGEGSSAAVDEIVRRYRPALVRYAASFVPPHRAEDVVQDAFARTLPRLRSQQGELALRPWLYTVVRNAALNDLRDTRPHEQLDENYDGVEQPPQAMERREALRGLVASMAGLPDAQREALVKRELEGRSHGDIASQLGVSEGAARQLIFRARVTLRDALGSMVPMPVLRHLIESGDGAPLTVGTAGGGALVAKAAVAVLATGAVVGAGVAIHRADQSNRALAEQPAHRSPPSSRSHHEGAQSGQGSNRQTTAPPRAGRRPAGVRRAARDFNGSSDPALSGENSGGRDGAARSHHDGGAAGTGDSGGDVSGHGSQGAPGSPASTGDDHRGAGAAGGDLSGSSDDNSGTGSGDPGSTGSGGGSDDGASLDGGSGSDGSGVSAGGSGGATDGGTTTDGGSSGTDGGSSGGDGSSTSGGSDGGSGSELSSSGDGAGEITRDSSSGDGFSVTTDQSSAG